MKRAIRSALFALPLGFLGGRAAAIAAVALWATGLGVAEGCLHAGIAHVLSMNKRGSAFGIFNGIYGVMWFLGSLSMGLLYSQRLTAMAALGMGAHLAAAFASFRLRTKL